jgi:hypothetical protein
MSLICQKVKECQGAAHSLHKISTNDSTRMAGVVRNTFDEILSRLKIEWGILCQHLTSVLTFSHEISDASSNASSEATDDDTKQLMVAVEGLAKSSQDVVESHASILELYGSAKHAILNHLHKHAASRKTKNRRAAVQEVFESEVESCEGCNLFTAFYATHLLAADNEVHPQPRPRRRSTDDEGVLALRTFEDTLHGMSPHLDDLSAFWRARSVDFSPASPDSESRTSTIASCYTWKIDAAVTNENRESISISLQALEMYVREEKRPKGRWERCLEWLRKS